MVKPSELVRSGNRQDSSRQGIMPEFDGLILPSPHPQRQQQRRVGCGTRRGPLWSVGMATRPPLRAKLHALFMKGCRESRPWRSFLLFLFRLFFYTQRFAKRADSTGTFRYLPRTRRFFFFFFFFFFCFFCCCFMLFVRTPMEGSLGPPIHLSTSACRVRPVRRLHHLVRCGRRNYKEISRLDGMDHRAIALARFRTSTA